MKKDPKISNIIIYQAPNGAIELKGDFDKETVWASLDQIANCRSFWSVDHQSVICKAYQNYTLFQKALSDIQKGSQNKLSAGDTLELVRAFA
jgi:hypothetical protein